MQRKSHTTTFSKYDKVNGRSYKTVRPIAYVGPTPQSVMPLEARQTESEVIEERVDLDSKRLDAYNEVFIEESLDSDGMDGWEAGMMQGFISS